MPPTKADGHHPESDGADLIEILCDRVRSSSAFINAVQQARIARLRRLLKDDGELVDSDLLKRLIRSSAILASSQAADNRRLAYAIATDVHYLTKDAELRFDGAIRVVLSRIGNFPAISTYAEIDAAASHLPLRLLLDEASAASEQTIRVGEGEAVLTDYQHELWTLFSSGSSAAIAAPTSAGKSFVLQAYLESLFTGNAAASVLYVVPTRALLSQVSEEVERALLQVQDPPHVTTVPPDAQTSIRERAVYVLTPERLQLLLAAHPEFAPGLIVVDEAHLIAEGARGVLLQWVLEEASARSVMPQLLFASPMIANLELFASLFGRADLVASRSSEATVAQNFIIVRSLPTVGEIELALPAEPEPADLRLGVLNTGHTLASKFDKLVHIPAALGRGQSNIVYVNGAADAEKVALQLADLFYEREATPAQTALAELARETVHRRYVLASTVQKGIGFHYANIPTNLRLAVERAFINGELDFMVCTSTLLQGVNTPAQNIFMYSPEKGLRKPIEPVDFWNLSGRAGRLRREFQGNIFLIDYADWKSKPLDGPKSVEIIPAMSKVLADADALIDVVLNREDETSGDRMDLESTFGKLLSDHRAGTLHQSLERIGLDPAAPATKAVVGAIQEASESISIPTETLKQSSNVSAHKQQQLFDYLRSQVRKEPTTATERLSPRHPRDPQAWESYSEILKVSYRIVLGFPDGNQLYKFHALLAAWWMQGLPLPQIIQNQIDRKQPRDERALIRETLGLVEEQVRFRIVRIFTTYTALLGLAYDSEQIAAGRATIPAIPLFLELGASDRSMISFLELGLSRVAARQLNDFAANKNMNTSEALSWLKTRSLESLGLSSLVQREIELARQRSS